MSPSVGIFWRASNDDGGFRLLTDSAPLQDAEPYGDCLTHPRGHHEVWERWRSSRTVKAGSLAIPRWVVENEYETFPRGRIVFHRPSETFWIYADRRLQRPEIIAEIRAAFDLEDVRSEVRSDAHYR